MKKAGSRFEVQGSRLKTKKKIEPFNFFTCETCEDHPVMDGVEELKKHLAGKHNVTEIKGTKQIQSFLDGSGFWEQIWELEIGGIKIIQDVGGPTRSLGDGA